jgi:hypothetical protein
MSICGEIWQAAQPVVARRLGGSAHGIRHLIRHGAHHAAHAVSGSAVKIVACTIVGIGTALPLGPGMAPGTRDAGMSDPSAAAAAIPGAANGLSGARQLPASTPAAAADAPSIGWLVARTPDSSSPESGMPAFDPSGPAADPDDPVTLLPEAGSPPGGVSGGGHEQVPEPSAILLLLSALAGLALTRLTKIQGKAKRVRPR